MSEEKIDNQIKNLFDEYVRHRKAYRHAISLTNQGRKAVKSGSAEMLDSGPMSQDELDWNDIKVDTEDRNESA